MGILNRTFKCVEIRNHSYLVFSFSTKKKQKKHAHTKKNNVIIDNNDFVKYFVTMLVSTSHLCTTSDNVRVIVDWCVSCRMRL